MTDDSIPTELAKPQQRSRRRVYAGLVLLSSVVAEWLMIKSIPYVGHRYYQDPAFEAGHFLEGLILGGMCLLLPVMAVSFVAIFTTCFNFAFFVGVFFILTFLADTMAVTLPAVRGVEEVWFRDQVASSAIPLIDAIHLYTQKTGEPPETVDDLVPDYLPEIPGTGINRYPEFTYERLRSATKPDRMWELTVPYVNLRRHPSLLRYVGIESNRAMGAKPVWERSSVHRHPVAR